MSVVIYDGVVLPYPLHSNFQQTALYDEEGQTDWYCTKFDVQVQCVISSNYLSLLAPDLMLPSGQPPTSNPAAIMNIIRSRLLKPRRSLKVLVNGTNLIPEPQQGLAGMVDAKNGPQPQYCKIMQLTNTTFLVEYHIIAHYWETNAPGSQGDLTTFPATNLPGNNVLYNRWSETVAIDKYNYSTRTRTGTFVIRSDNKDGNTADELRAQMVVLAIPKGFIRESSNYTISPDGLGIKYTLVDKEVYKLPPQEAFEAIGDYSLTASRNGAKVYAEVNLELRGAKNTPQDKLVIAAITICNRKVRGDIGNNTFIRDKIGVNESFSVTVGMYENWVKVHMRCMLKNTNARIGDTAGIADTANQRASLIFTPKSDNVKDADAWYKDRYLLRGTASLLLDAAFYNDPGLQSVVLGPNSNGQVNAGIPIGTAGKILEP